MSLNKLQNDYVTLTNELNSVSIHDDPKKETLYRGRLIRVINAMLQKHSDSLTPSQISYFKRELSSQINEHKNQISARILNSKLDKTIKKYSISNEVALKMKKTAASFKEIKLATTDVEREKAIKEALHNSLSTAFSMSKYAIKPVTFAVKKAGGAAGKIVGGAVGLGADLAIGTLKTTGKVAGKLVAYPFKALITADLNPHINIEQIIRQSYNFDISKMFSGKLGDFAESNLEKLEDSIMRL